MVDDELRAAHEAVKGTSLADADIYLTGTRGHLPRHPVGRQVRHDDRWPSPP